MWICAVQDTDFISVFFFMYLSFKDPEFKSSDVQTNKKKGKEIQKRQRAYH